MLIADECENSDFERGIVPVLEENRILPRGVIQGLKVTLCDVIPVYVQIWEKVIREPDSHTYRLIWQKQIRKQEGKSPRHQLVSFHLCVHSYIMHKTYPQHQVAS